MADSTIWRMADEPSEAKAFKLRACKSQICNGLVADSPWPSKTAGDVVDVVDRFQTILMETLELSNAILVREAAIQMAYKRMEIEADLALLPIGESWGWAVSVAITTVVEQMREAVVTKRTRAMVVHREK